MPCLSWIFKTTFPYLAVNSKDASIVGSTRFGIKYEFESILGNAQELDYDQQNTLLNDFHHFTAWLKAHYMGSPPPCNLPADYKNLAVFLLKPNEIESGKPNYPNNCTSRQKLYFYAALHFFAIAGEYIEGIDSKLVEEILQLAVERSGVSAKKSLAIERKNAPARICRPLPVPTAAIFGVIIAVGSGAIYSTQRHVDWLNLGNNDLSPTEIMDIVLTFVIGVSAFFIVLSLAFIAEIKATFRNSFFCQPSISVRDALFLPVTADDESEEEAEPVTEGLLITSYNSTQQTALFVGEHKLSLKNAVTNTEESEVKRVIAGAVIIAMEQNTNAKVTETPASILSWAHTRENLISNIQDFNPTSIDTLLDYTPPTIPKVKVTPGENDNGINGSVSKKSYCC